MKKVFQVLKNRRYISLLSEFLLLFTYLAATRSYIYENINKSLVFGQTGTPDISVGATVTGTLVAAAVLGVIICWFARDKFTERTTINLYIIAAFWAIVLLFFTPYNLSLLSPSTNGQNISTINLIVVIFLAAVGVILFTVAIGSHFAEYFRDGSFAPLVAAFICASVAVVLSLLAAEFTWSFTICTAVYAAVLLAVNMVNSFIQKKGDEYTDAPVRDYKIYIVCAIIILLALGVAVGGHFLSEPAAPMA